MLIYLWYDIGIIRLAKNNPIIQGDTLWSQQQHPH